MIAVDNSHIGKSVLSNFNLGPTTAVQIATIKSDHLLNSVGIVWDASLNTENVGMVE